MLKVCSQIMYLVFYTNWGHHDIESLYLRIYVDVVFEISKSDIANRTLSELGSYIVQVWVNERNNSIYYNYCNIHFVLVL